MSTSENGPNVTPRELEILELVWEGFTNAKEIAQELEISVQTVKNHLNNAYKGLGLPSDTSHKSIVAILICLDNGFLEIPRIREEDTPIVQRLLADDLGVSIESLQSAAVPAT